MIEDYDAPFTNGGWDKNDGPGQARYFARLMLDNLPADIRLEMSDCVDIVDWGCATGEGTAEWASEFPGALVTGIDASTAAVGMAAERHIVRPNLTFFHTDPSCYDFASYDVVVTSNMLEHIDDPHVEICRLLEKADRFCVILVPWTEEDRIPGHVYTFTEADFPAVYFGWERVHLQVLPPGERYWGKEQAFVVYRRRTS